MFYRLFTRSRVIARHTDAPFLQERVRYLEYCRQRGDTRATLKLKARELLWVARALAHYPGLDISMAQLRAAATDHWKEREAAYERPLNARWTRRRFIHVGRAWLHYLGYLRRPQAPLPYEARLDAYCHWARNERGLSETTIARSGGSIAQFLRWYATLGKSLEAIQISDIDAYLGYGASRGWCRATVHNVAGVLRVFFRYGAQQGWCDRCLAEAIHGPRIYAMENVPSGPSWRDVEQLFAALDPNRPKDVRDRAILLLLTVYGLRESEVIQLRLEDIDWADDLLFVSRGKGRGRMCYPLLTSVGSAMVDYLRTVRPVSRDRQVFLSLLSPHQPLSRAGLYALVARRLKTLDVAIPHFGPHSLRHACAARLVAQGLPLKAIGDHLGHRSSSATRIYAKVDMTGLREVAAFDLGELS
jgi:integrase/recombinase XerD